MAFSLCFGFFVLTSGGRIVYLTSDTSLFNVFPGAHLGRREGGYIPALEKPNIYVPSKCCKSAFTMCPVRAIFLEFTKNALKLRPLRALFFEFTKSSHEMCPLWVLSLKFTKSAHKFALFQHHIPCPQKMLDARLSCISSHIT